MQEDILKSLKPDVIVQLLKMAYSFGNWAQVETEVMKTQKTYLTIIATAFIWLCTIGSTIDYRMQ
ncbi:UNVERIFIED_CONTAM: hypothetical protein ABIC26_000490 [Paenibacillus sp. PvR008]